MDTAASPKENLNFLAEFHPPRSLQLNDVLLPIWGRETAKRENNSTSSSQTIFMKTQ